MPPKKRNAAHNNKEKQGIKRTSPDKKEDQELSVERHKEKDAEFVAICKSLHVTDLVCDNAWTLWETVNKSMDKVPDTQTRVWGACLYVVATDWDITSFTLTQVLKTVDLNVKQFLALLKKVDVNMDTITAKVNSALTRLEKKYDVSLALYQRFEKTCSKIYASTHENGSKEILRSCWIMFLLAKGRALQVEDDLVISFQLLLCVLEFFIKRCSHSLLQPLYKSAVNAATPTRVSRRNQTKPRPQATPGMDAQLLETLCKENDCSLDEVRNVYQTSFSAFLDSMSLPLGRAQDLPQESDLSQRYEDLHRQTRGFDERLFLDGDATLLSPAVIVATQVERTPVKNRADEDTAPVVPPQTPIRAAMNSIHQLKFELTTSADRPSAALAVYFQNCTRDPTEGVLQRVERLGQQFSQRFGQAVGLGCVGLGQQRFTWGVRLYYRVMEAMLKSEEKRLSVQNFSELLNDATFHTSLLACALEVVMATYAGRSLKNGGGVPGAETTDICFPWILDVFSLAAFDFYKVIESFIKAEPTLSKDIVKHLERCEHLVMETIAWRRDSPLFELLRRNQEETGPVEGAEPPASLNQPLQHNHTAADLYLSSVRPGGGGSTTSPARPGAQLPPSSPAPLQNQVPRQPKSNSLSLFYKKLYRLAYMRLKMLFSALLTSHAELEPVMWTLFQHTLQHEAELLRDRHLDQLMMSAMYAICKVKNVDLRFKTIVTAYKSMPNTNQETFKHVLIAEGKYDSIIVFYNMVFMQKLKTNILQYASPRPPTLSPIPQIPRSPYKFPNSPLLVPGSNNVYISPMKNSRMSPGGALTMTPRSRMLVSIGESFGTSNKFQKINQMVNSGDWSNKRALAMGSALADKPQKRLRFDVDGQDEADGSKAAGDSTLIQKLAEMSSTRSRMQEQKLKEAAEKEKP